MLVNNLDINEVKRPTFKSEFGTKDNELLYLFNVSGRRL